MENLPTNTPLDEQEPPEQNLSIIAKLIYGSGDGGRASFNTLRQIFYAIFLTDVVGIDPRLASIAALVSILWDAINDPIVGSLSDNVRTRWGRRRPFLLVFAIPFALAFVLLWWAPPWQTQIALVAHVTLAYMLSDTIQTLITVPYLALTPEIAKDYDERTSLTSFRMFFNLVASLLTAVLAPTLIDHFVTSGMTLQQSYLTMAAIFGGAAILPFLLIFALLKEKEAPALIPPEEMTFKRTLLELWQNRPFRYATGVYVLNWIAFDIVALMVPYFLLYWIAQGDLLAKFSLLGQNISLESIVLGAIFIIAILTLPFWNWLAKKRSKTEAYIIGASIWAVLQIFVFLLAPEQKGFMVLLAALIGITTSNAHIIPEAIFPDVIDWAELKTNNRREGMYYGSINFIRKLASAIAIFLALQVLGWFGYQTPPQNTQVFTQPSSALLAIRIMTGPFITLLLLGAIGFALRYPITRERQARIQHSLTRRIRKSRKSRKK
jgi:GPH family glycoside/pentoside/hexuronide:cation symporter